MGHFSDSFLIITGGIRVFESISVLDGFNGGGIRMMSLANTTILLGNGAGWGQSGVTVGRFQDLSAFLDKFIAGFLGQ